MGLGQTSKGVRVCKLQCARAPGYLPVPMLALMCGWRERATDRALMSSGRSVSLTPWGSEQGESGGKRRY